MKKNVSVQSSGLIHQMKEMYRTPDTPRVRNESLSAKYTKSEE